MCVGGKGVTRGRQRLSLETAPNKEMLEFPSNRFQTSLVPVRVLAFASPCKIHTRAEQCAAHLALGVKRGSFNPSHSCNNHITTSLVTKISKAKRIAHTIVYLRTNSIEHDTDKCLCCVQSYL